MPFGLRRTGRRTRADEGQAGANGPRERPSPAGRISPDEKLITLTEGTGHVAEDGEEAGSRGTCRRRRLSGLERSRPRLSGGGTSV